MGRGQVKERSSDQLALFSHDVDRPHKRRKLYPSFKSSPAMKRSNWLTQAVTLVTSYTNDGQAT